MKLYDEEKLELLLLFLKEDYRGKVQVSLAPLPRLRLVR